MKNLYFLNSHINPITNRLQGARKDATITTRLPVASYRDRNTLFPHLPRKEIIDATSLMFTINSYTPESGREFEVLSEKPASWTVFIYISTRSGCRTDLVRSSLPSASIGKERAGLALTDVVRPATVRQSVICHWISSSQNKALLL